MSEALMNTEGLSIAEQQELEEAMKEAFQENMDGVTPRLPVITLSGGFFKLPPDKDHSDEWTTKNLTCVILRKQAVRSYYKPRDNQDEIVPPDCYSTDCIKPGDVENPMATTCEACEMNRWGSAKDDTGAAMKGKACREKRRLFVQIGDSPLPYMLHIPLTSLKKFDGFVTNLTSARIPVLATKVKMMASEASRGQMKWTVLDFERGSVLSPKEFLNAKKMREQIQEESNEDNTDDIPF